MLCYTKLWENGKSRKSISYILNTKYMYCILLHFLGTSILYFVLIHLFEGYFVFCIKIHFDVFLPISVCSARGSSEKYPQSQLVILMWYLMSVVWFWAKPDGDDSGGAVMRTLQMILSFSQTGFIYHPIFTFVSNEIQLSSSSTGNRCQHEWAVWVHPASQAPNTSALRKKRGTEAGTEIVPGGGNKQLWSARQCKRKGTSRATHTF